MAACGPGVVTGGNCGLRASGGGGSAKNAGDAGLMTAWYSAPQSLAPQGASPGGRSGVSGGTGRCPTCPAANARQRGRRAARAPSATSRSRAKGGVSSTAIALRRAVDRAGPTNRSGVQGATGRGARSHAGRRRNPKSCPIRGGARRPARRMAGGPGVVGTRRGRRMRRQGKTRQRADAATWLRDSNDLPGRDRIAHHNLAASTGSPGRLARPGASGVRCAPIPRLPDNLTMASGNEFGERV